MAVNLVKGTDGKIRYEVNGTMLRGNILPAVGLSTVRSVGSDHYAQKITKVAEDYSWFELETGELAVLVTRKNSKRLGRYVKGEIKNGKRVPGPTPYWTCMGYDTFHVVDYEAKTELDPSF